MPLLPKAAPGSAQKPKKSLILLFENKYATLGMRTEATHPNNDPHCAFATNSSTRLRTQAQRNITHQRWSLTIQVADLNHNPHHALTSRAPYSSHNHKEKNKHEKQLVSCTGTHVQAAHPHHAPHLSFKNSTRLRAQAPIKHRNQLT